MDDIEVEIEEEIEILEEEKDLLVEEEREEKTQEVQIIPMDGKNKIYFLKEKNLKYSDSKNNPDRFGRDLFVEF